MTIHLLLTRNAELLFGILVPMLLLLGCGKTEQPKQQARSEQKPAGPQLPSHLSVVSSADSLLVINGRYTYTGNQSSDASAIQNDVWTISKQYPNAKRLRLSVSFSGTNKYGESINQEVGNYKVDDLNEVRRFASADYYNRDISAASSIVHFLMTSYGSPYYFNRLATQHKQESQPMNDSQTIFTVFFAIFWGLIANVQPRWKAFQLPLAFSLHWPRRRAILSVCTFNILPLAFYAWTLNILNNSDQMQSTWTFSHFLTLIVRSVTPAFAAFGFYRLWLSVIEFWPCYFYAATQNDLPQQWQRIVQHGLAIEPSLDELSIRRGTRSARGNLFWSIVYFILAFGSPIIFR